MAIAQRSGSDSSGQRPSLVDSAEQALRNWLAPGRHRVGDRLPPEQEVAAMLGISRGTLRTALQRLEETGEIVRRQGSGTFVGRVAVPTQLDERLERLEPYSSLAKRRGVTLSAEQVRIERRAVGSEVGEMLELDAATEAITICRVLMASGSPAAVMFDVPHPAVALPDPDRIERLLKGGKMLLDVMIELKLPIGFARTRVTPRLVTPRDQTGKALQLECSTAALELEEVVYLGSGAPVAYSRDLFAPGALDVGVMRSFDAARPTPIAPRGGARRRARARAPRHGH